LATKIAVGAWLSGDRKAHWLTDCPFDLAGADHAEPVALSGDLAGGRAAIFG
jgi:hypothetical protein